MARGARILRARLDLSLVDRGCYETLELTVAQHPSETLERALVRILARGLWHEPGLDFGRGVSSTDEPDLWRCEPDGRVLHWIEVGQPKAPRLQKAARRADRVSVLAFGRGAERWRERELTGSRGTDEVHVLGLDDRFVDALAQGAERQLEWTLTSSGGVLYVTTDPGRDPVETTPEVWRGDPLG